MVLVGSAISRPRALSVASLVLVCGAALACSAGGNPGRGGGSSGAGTGTTSGGTSANGGSAGTTGGAAASAGGNASGATGASGNAQGGTSTSSGGSAQTSGGSSATSGGAGPTAGNAGAGAMPCQMANYTFMPKIPTVYVMVDRSGSMFDCQSTATTRENSCENQADTAWVKLREATLQVIRALQADVRFGFASFTGTDPAHGGTCPQLDQVDAGLNNADKIAMVYNGLPFQPNTNESGKKFETPAGQALLTVGNKLIADTYPGDKYILFVTDGQPDYCDDSNTLCAPDSVVWSLQTLKAKNVSTIVMGLQSMGVNDLAPGILDSFANAGAGEATKAPLREGLNAFAFYDQCNFIPGWGNDLTASGKPKERGTTLGTYSETAGPTKPYTPNSNDQAALTTQLGQALAGVKSCNFDLSNVNGQSIKVDLNKLAEASISIEGNKVMQDATTGWSMASQTQLVLNGGACDTWRMPDVNDISFNFPCKTIIFE